MKPTKPTTLPLIALAALATAGAAQDHAAFAPPQAPSYAAYDACAGLCKTTYVHCGAALHFATSKSRQPFALLTLTLSLPFHSPVDARAPLLPRPVPVVLARARRVRGGVRARVHRPARHAGSGARGAASVGGVWCGVVTRLCS